MAQQDHVIAVAVLLGPRSATAGAATVIPHADERALVERVERQGPSTFFDMTRHRTRTKADGNIELITQGMAACDGGASGFR